MPFLENHASQDEPFTRVFFYSVLLHYALFFIFFGNPFLLKFEDVPEGAGEDKIFDVHLSTFPGAVDNAAKIESLGLFLPEVERGGGAAHENRLKPSTPEAGPSAFAQSDPSAVPDMEEKKRGNVTGQGGGLNPAALKTEGKVFNPDQPVPLVTSQKLPPNMTGPEDCMIKVVGMVCPNGDAKCIEEYTAFCTSLPK